MKDNKLIAEFMGFTKDSKDLYLIDDYNLRGEDEYQATYVSEMKFHTSWDWLMPVANEIIKSRDEQNYDWDLTELKYALCTTNIAWVYNAVINFINKYNK